MAGRHRGVLGSGGACRDRRRPRPDPVCRSPLVSHPPFLREGRPDQPPHQRLLRGRHHRLGRRRTHPGHRPDPGRGGPQLGPVVPHPSRARNPPPPPPPPPRPASPPTSPRLTATTAGHDTYLSQTYTHSQVHPDGDLLTISAWVWVPSADYQGDATGSLGLPAILTPDAGGDPGWPAAA